MTSQTDRIIWRARSLAGTPFRPQGRDLDSGLDCVGLILCTFRIPADQVRRDYRLRGPNEQEIQAELAHFFRRVPLNRRRPGDVLLCAVSGDQMHLAIDCGLSFVHADARLRRVVETPGAPRWPIVGVFRRRARRARSS